jgi:hypothetical protein
VTTHHLNLKEELMDQKNEWLYQEWLHQEQGAITTSLSFICALTYGVLRAAWNINKSTFNEIKERVDYKHGKRE